MDFCHRTESDLFLFFLFFPSSYLPPSQKIKSVNLKIKFLWPYMAMIKYSDEVLYPVSIGKYKGNVIIVLSSP